MKTKEADVRYCGVRKEVIEKAKPEFYEGSMNLFMRYVTRRYRIHVSKDVLYKNPPWTKDEILKKFRFTNIRREHDRESKWLIENISENKFLTYRQKLMNTILFRLFNKHETMEIAGGPFKFESLWTFVPSRNRLYNYAKQNPKYVFFTNAFITGGLKLALKKLYPQESFVPGLVMRYMKRLNENGLMNRIMEAKTQKEVFEALSNEKGIGNFLAYQIFVDFTYIEKFPFSENEFTIAGPGCRKGLDFLFKDKDGMNYEECLFWLRDNWNNLTEYLDDERYWFNPEEEMVDLKRYDRVMNVMSLENCFCEYSKYYRAVKDLGRPRNNYKRRKDDE